MTCSIDTFWITKNALRAKNESLIMVVQRAMRRLGTQFALVQRQEGIVPKMFKIGGVIAGSTISVVLLMVLYAKLNGNPKIDKAVKSVLDGAVEGKWISADTNANVTDFLIEILAASPSVIMALARAKHTPRGMATACAFVAFPIVWFFMLCHDEGMIYFVQSMLILSVVIINDDEVKVAITGFFALCVFFKFFKIKP